MRPTRFRGLPIGTKLVVAFSLVAALALVLAAAFFSGTALKNMQVSAQNELQGLAGLIGANSTAALAFGDANAARETLATLSTVPDVELALIYDKSGREFARYERNAGAKTDQTAPQVSFIPHQVKVSAPVVLEGQMLGKVEIFASLASRFTQLRRELRTILFATLVSLAVAMLIAWRLQRSITWPIGILTDALQTVSREHNYRLRVPVTHADEIGVLQRGINDMLQRVEERDSELEQHRNHLQDEVSRRTTDLEGANRKLKEELSERERAEAELTQAHQALERHHQEFALLTEMNERLQVCHSMEETRPVISFYINRLFPVGSGAIYQLNDSRTLVATIAQWGDDPPKAKTFSPSDCWGLRQGRIHAAETPETSLVCPHCRDDVQRPYLCVPMLAYGEVIGLVHVRMPAGGTGIPADIRQFSVTTSEHLALALASLKLRETLRAQSVRDPLTGLFNRRFMEESLEREFARAERADGKVAVIMMDIDHFKTYNDNFGHEAGDQVLAQVGEHFQRGVRTADIACRYGGEEFAVILPGLDAEGAVERAKELCGGIKKLDIRHQGRRLEGISLSAGVAAYPLHGRTSSDVLNAADAALYEAKTAGRDRVVLAVPGKGKIPSE